jgi:hypothetical protein
MNMAKFAYTVVTENKYPIETSGRVEVGGWRAAAGKAVKAHMDELKVTRKGKRLGDKMIVKLTKLKDVVETTPEKTE